MPDEPHAEHDEIDGYLPVRLDEQVPKGSPSFPLDFIDRVLHKKHTYTKGPHAPTHKRKKTAVSAVSEGESVR